MDDGQVTKKAQNAINDVHMYTSISLEEVRDNLKYLSEHIDWLIEAVDMDIENKE